MRHPTLLPVCEARPGQVIEADHVYVIPPNTTMTVAQGLLQLRAPAQTHGLRRPVDLLFESLAREQAGAAVGVVLSGMGSDGAAGLRAIRAQGGLTLAQRPESAQFDAMPRSAIATGSVDIVCEARAMPQRIRAALQARLALQAPPPLPPLPDAPADADAKPGGDLRSVLDLLRLRGKHDFRLYKQTTLSRRIERRMGIHHLSTLQAYAQMLHSNPQELDLLYKELLIGVTAFFRDGAVWQALLASALPGLLRAHADGDPLRAWVAGCSTGEEAFSLAMAFGEAVDAMPDRSRCTLQVFATDLSRDAVERARRAVYPRSIAGEVSAARLMRFFTAQDKAYRINKDIRETIVFAPHDLTADRPFTKLDLLSCRNLLIYLTAPLQRRLLALFHYSLRPHGLLMLGTSETVGRLDDLFEPLDVRQRLYRRRAGVPAAALAKWALRVPPPAAQPPEESTPMAQHPHLAPSLQAVADQLLLQSLAPPAVPVDERGDIVYISGHTGKYLEPAAGKANWNILVMAREGLRAPLQQALLQMQPSDGTVVLHGLPLDGEGGVQRVDLTLRALTEPPLVKGMRLIVFRDVVLPAKGRRRRSGALQSALEIELQRAREDTQAMREEMRASQEELQAANEELQSTHEELQVLNSELQSKLDDLDLAQSDVGNLLNSPDIATLFLDAQLNVRRFTERARKIISLRDTDIGRPLADLSNRLPSARSTAATASGMPCGLCPTEPRMR